MAIRLRGPRAWAIPLALAAAACTPPPKGDKGVPFDQLTIENVVRWPDGRDYVTVKGTGYPGEGQKLKDARRKSARDGALLSAQEKLIDQLKKLRVPQDRIENLLHSVQLAQEDYAYDDICTVTLRLDKALLGDKPREASSWQDQ